MSRIMGIQFQKNGKLYYFDANGIEAEAGNYVIADTLRGLDLGEVVIAAREMNEISETETLKKVIRLATEQDIQTARENRVREKEAFAICQRKIAEHKLEMKLVSVEYPFDGSKILFYFTANGRVDFRSLVKDLASVFKMRIELRQIGVRDEAKMLGGLGPCGRPICCGSFLSQFQPVSIKMAKEQNLSLNPTKISGVCGRLMCCLKYEQDHYEQTRKRMPKIGRVVNTPDGTGPVTELNIVKETVFVRLTNGDTSEIKEYPLENITKASENVRRERENFETAENEAGDSQAEKTEGKDSPAVKNEAKSGPAVKNETKDGPAGRNETRDGQGPRNPAKANGSNAGKGETRGPRNRGKNHQLGQPVQRENPNRTPNAEGARNAEGPRNNDGARKQDGPRSNDGARKQDGLKEAEAVKKESKGENDRPKAAEPRKGKKSSWADAVENAIRSIDQV